LRDERLYRADSEAKPRGQRVRPRHGQHAVGSIDAGRLARLKPIVQNARQLAGPATQVDDAHPGDAPYERQQVEKRLLALTLKPVVLAWVPAIDHTAPRWRPWSLVRGPGTTDQERTRD